MFFLKLVLYFKQAYNEEIEFNTVVPKIKIQKGFLIYLPLIIYIYCRTPHGYI